MGHPLFSFYSALKKKTDKTLSFVTNLYQNKVQDLGSKYDVFREG